MSNKFIGVLGLNLCRPMTGVGRYISHLSELVECKYFVYVPNDNIQIPHKYNNVIKSNSISKIAKLFWILFPPFNSNLKIIHYPQPLISLFKKNNTKVIVTVHDVIFLDNKEYYSWFEYIYSFLFLRFSLIRSDKIICVSNYTKSRLEFHFPKYKKNFKVIYNPVIIPFSDTSNYLLKKSKIKVKKYMLCVSNRVKRKNLSNTISGFLESKYAKEGFKLVICGSSDSITNFDFPDSVIDLGYVNDDQLENLYKNAFALLFFSLAEGFGYPILEAAKHKTVVFASNNTSISELFNYNNHLLCSNYFSSNGITKFLDYTFENYGVCSEILNVLSKTINLCSLERFREEMNKAYNEW